jgi:hypothetical protein
VELVHRLSIGYGDLELIIIGIIFGGIFVGHNEFSFAEVSTRGLRDRVPMGLYRPGSQMSLPSEPDLPEAPLTYKWARRPYSQPQ